MDIRSLDIPVNAVATALKQFFSDLPEPLIPGHDDFLDAACEFQHLFYNCLKFGNKECDSKPLS